MKIAFFTSRFPEPNDTFFENHVSCAIELGYQVDIYTRNSPLKSTGQTPTKTTEILKRTLRVAIKADHVVILKKWLGASNARRIAHLHSLWVSRKHYPPNIQSHFHNSRYDIIHCSHGNLGVYAIELRKAGLISGPIVTAFQGPELGNFLRKKGSDFYEKLFQEGQHFLPNCSYLEKRLEKLGCPADKITTFYNRIDTDYFSFCDRKFEPKAFSLCFAGSLEQQKSLGTCLTAMSLLSEKHPNLQFTIAGEGPEKNKLICLTEDLGLVDRVEFTGPIDPVKLRELYNKSHLFLATSSSFESLEQEGLNNSVKEAGSTGLPVIVTDHGGLIEAVPKDNGDFIVSEGDPVDLARKIDSLVSTPERLTCASRAIRKHVESSFSSRNYTTKIKDQFERISQNNTTQRSVEYR